MKVLLVTSQITYVPRNYLDLFEELFARAGAHIAGLVLLQNASPRLLAQSAGIFALGAPGIASSIFRNFAELPLRRRERLFEERGLPVLRSSTMNDATMVSFVRDQGIDLVVNARTRCIYKREVLEAPRLGCINIHHGILPRYRGTMCDLYALYEGRPAGFTIHQMNEKIDAGRIFLVREMSRAGELDYPAYLGRTGAEEGRALAELVLDVAERGALPAGTPNTPTEADAAGGVVFTRNPKRHQIRAMKRAGLRL